MEDTEYTLETVHQIWNDKSGTRIEIGPDRDGLDLIEIRSYTDDGKIGQSVTFTEKEFRLLSVAIDRMNR
jgi:hypothetical protein